MDIAAEKALKAKGVDIRGRRTQAAFYHDNPAVFQSVKATGFGYEDYSYQILRGDNVNLGQLFMNYRASSLSAKVLGEIARKHKSYHGLEMALDAYLDWMMKLQPFKMYLRALVPLLLIQLGRDDEAYNFIKFWLKNTPKSCDFQISEDGLFLEKDLPFTEYTMKDQDKNEDIFQALDINMDEKPYFIYITFFVCLSIIKKNIYDASKDETQKSLFIKCLSYAKKHFGDIMRRGLQFPPDYQRFTPRFIPAAKFGLKGGLNGDQMEVQIFGGDFLNNFIDDLNSYLKRAPGLKEALLNYL